MTKPKPSKVYNGRTYRSSWEARHAERLDRWKAAGTVVAWEYEKLPIPLEIAGRPVLTPKGRQATYRPDFVVEFADGTRELHEVKSSRRSGLEFRRWWLVLQIVRAMGWEVLLIGADGNPSEEL